MKKSAEKWKANPFIYLVQYLIFIIVFGMYECGVSSTVQAMNRPGTHAHAHTANSFIKEWVCVIRTFYIR